MSSRQPPPLPATLDPFELLGIEPGVSELDAKRAYVRMIKTYRPEKFPEEFQRLHRAYEEVRRMIAWGWDSYPPSDDDTGEGELDDDHAELAAGEDGDELDDGWDDLEPESETSAGELDGYFDTDYDELEAFAKEPGSTWHVLRERLPLEAAAEVFELRVEDQLARDRVAELLDEMLEDPSLANDLLGIEELEATVMCAVFAGVWTEPERTRRLLDRLGDCLGSYAGELYSEVVSFAPRLARMRVPAPLAKLLRLYPVLGWEQQEEIRAEVRSDLARRPFEYLYALDEIAKESPLMLAFLVQQIGYGADVHGGRPGQAEADAIDQVMHEIDARLDRESHNGLYGATAILAVGLIAAAFRRSVWLGGAVLVALVVALVVAVGLTDPRHYRKRVRPALCEVIVRHGTVPYRFIQWLENNGRWFDEIGRFKDEISDDTGLDVLGALVRFSRDDDE